MSEAATPGVSLFYPPSVTPPSEPLPLGRFLLTFVRNPLLSLPAPVYEQPIFTYQSRPGTYVAWVTSPPLIERILVTEAEVFSKTPMEKRVLGRSLGTGVLTSQGHLWRWQRRTMAPLFRQREILSYVPAMTAAAQEQLDQWRTEPGRRIRAVDAAMTDTTFKIIARTMLAGGEPREAARLKRAGERYLSRISWEMAFAMLRIPEWVPHPASYTIWHNARVMRQAVLDIVRRRRTEVETAADLPQDLLARLLAARDPETGEPMDDDRLVDNLLTLLEAGHETTAKALTWSLYLLSRAPEWQDRIREEVRAIAGDSPLTSDHVEHLPVTSQILKEALRLYPPAPVMMRMPTRDVDLAGHELPAGSFIIIPIFALHRHRMLWADPDRFAPERFTPEFEENLARTQYMPFGAGPRICLGMSFAMVEAKVLLATLVRGARFSWDGCHAPEPISRITLRPKGGMPVIVEPL